MSAQDVRCFISIHLPTEVKNKISDYIIRSREYSNNVRWVRAENIHLTLKFLGEIEFSRVELVKECLYPISNDFSSFNVNISGSGCFPSIKRPRVFWIGVEQGKENPLFAVHQWIENQLLELNYEKEKRRFSPHLTLGRVRVGQSVDFTNLLSFFEKDPFAPIKFSVRNIYFMRSDLKPTGAEYQVIEKYPLK